jgi:hypothetical protein
MIHEIAHEMRSIISPSHFISSRGVDEEEAVMGVGYLDIEVPCIESLNGCQY